MRVRINNIMLNKATLKRYYLLVLLTLFLVCLGYVTVSKQLQKKQTPTSSLQPTVTQTHKVHFFEEKAFPEGVTAAQKTILPDFSQRQIVGGITPHHLLPSTLLSRFFTTISTAQPTTVIVIGPNHNEKGNLPILTSMYAWETPNGTVQPDLETIANLTKNPMFGIDEDVLPADHAATGSIPYISYYMPKARVVPILISNRMTLAQIQAVVPHFVDSLPKNTVIVAAIDFSHYLNEKQAEEKDIVTEKLIRTHDYEKIMSLNNDYTDSPVPLTFFLMVMDKLSANQIEMLDHTNSGILLKEPNIPTTSYFSTIFFKKNN